MTYWPAGARVGSFVDGMTQSISGRGEGCPYLAASQARSRYSSVGLMMNSGCCGPSSLPGRAVNDGSPDSARFTLADGLRVRNCRTSWTSESGRCDSPTMDRNVVAG